MNEKIILSSEFFVGNGIERECYIHSLDITKVIKIERLNNRKTNRNQNSLDYKYFKFLEKQKIPLTHIPKCYGYVNTNLGNGLVFDRVYDYDGKNSISFLKVIIENKLSKGTQVRLLEELRRYLFKYNILFVDVALHNVLCCEYEKNKYRLIIIDGLGAKRIGIKFWLYLRLKLFTRYKIIKSWKKFLKRYNKKQNIKIYMEKEWVKM